MAAGTFISAVLPSLIDTIEIRSRAHPPIKLKIADLLAPAKPGDRPSPVIAALKPTVIITGAAFPKPQVIAPAGPVSESAWKVSAAVVLGLAAVGGFVAVTTLYRLGKRSGK